MPVVPRVVEWAASHGPAALRVAAQPALCALPQPARRRGQRALGVREGYPCTPKRIINDYPRTSKRYDLDSAMTPKKISVAERGSIWVWEWVPAECAAVSACSMRCRALSPSTPSSLPENHAGDGPVDHATQFSCHSLSGLLSRKFQTRFGVSMAWCWCCWCAPPPSTSGKGSVPSLVYSAQSRRTQLWGGALRTERSNGATDTGRPSGSGRRCAK